MAAAGIYGSGAESSICFGCERGGGRVDHSEEPGFPPDRAAAAKISNPGWPVGQALNVGTESGSEPA